MYVRRRKQNLVKRHIVVGYPEIGYCHVNCGTKVVVAVWKRHEGHADDESNVPRRTGIWTQGKQQTDGQKF